MTDAEPESIDRIAFWVFLSIVAFILAFSIVASLIGV